MVAKSVAGAADGAYPGGYALTRGTSGARETRAEIDILLRFARKIARELRRSDVADHTMLLPLPRRVLRFAVDPAGEFLCVTFVGGVEAELHDLRRPRAPAWRLADTEAAAFVVPEDGDGGALCATLARGPAPELRLHAPPRDRATRKLQQAARLAVDGAAGGGPF